MQKIAEQISKLHKLPEKGVVNTIKLFSDGASIPFIARYRKDVTGGLSDEEVEMIVKSYKSLLQIEERKSAILKILESDNLLTDELKSKIDAAIELSEVEDLYLPFKKRKKTKADEAIENGLLPLAKMIMSGRSDSLTFLANLFIKGNIASENDALAGAKFIIAQWFNENAFARKLFRQQLMQFAQVKSVLKKNLDESIDASKYQDYHDFSELYSKIPAHRAMALLRGKHLGILNLKLALDAALIEKNLERVYFKPQNIHSDFINDAHLFAYKKYLLPALESDLFSLLKEKSERSSVKIFRTNAEQLLKAAPIGQQRVLAIDPGFQSGCKVVVLNEMGSPEHNETIYPHPPKNEKVQASKKINTLVSSHKVQAIAIGNATAGRETEEFIKHIRFNDDVKVYVVDESGASVYSASSLARKEFPQYDVTVRGAISIGRRLQDPLAELVKIDPKSLGVGQYQHDINQKMLEEELKQGIENVVNSVGVNLNLASEFLLKYISGIGEKMAESIVEYRANNGEFQSRTDLLKVPKIGAKAFEQASGFLRIYNGENVLDTTGIHPEHYKIVEDIAKELSIEVKDLLRNKKAIESIDSNPKWKEVLGLHTFELIKKELMQPSRDFRKEAKIFEFDKNIRSIQQLQMGMELNGIISNVTHFGAFVNIGLKENGLVHKSQLSKEFVENPSDAVFVNQQVRVKVLEVDIERKRIALSMIL